MTGAVVPEPYMHVPDYSPEAQRHYWIINIVHHVQEAPPDKKVVVRLDGDSRVGVSPILCLHCGEMCLPGASPVGCLGPDDE